MKNTNPHTIAVFNYISAADLANLVNVAAIKAAVEGAEKLNAAQLEFAKDRIIMGTERKTMYLSEDSKKVHTLLHYFNFWYPLKVAIFFDPFAYE